VDFQEADRRYAKIKRHQEAGGLTQEEFDRQLEALMVQDEEGRWWAKSRTSGDWHYHDGTAWVRGKPPAYQGHLTGPEDKPDTQQSESLEAEERTQRVATLYDQGQRYMKAEEWQQAVECFEEVQRLEPNYRETQALLEQTRQEVSAEDAGRAEAGERSREQMAGQSTDQAERVQPDYSTDTQPQPTLPILGRNWWALVSAALIIAVHGLLGSLVSFEPFSTLIFLASLTIATGVFFIIAGNTAHPVLLLRIQGTISVLAGMVIVISDLARFGPGDGLTSGFLAICLGIILMIAAIRLWHALNVMWLLLGSGALLVVSGIHLFYLIYIELALGQTSWVYETPRLLGIWGLASGISLVAFAFRARHLEVSEVEG
jgi:tetratricopeptide (TPR) repeat protein